MERQFLDVARDGSTRVRATSGNVQKHRGVREAKRKLTDEIPGMTTSASLRATYRQGNTAGREAARQSETDGSYGSARVWMEGRASSQKGRRTSRTSRMMVSETGSSSVFSPNCWARSAIFREAGGLSRRGATQRSGDGFPGGEDVQVDENARVLCGSDRCSGEGQAAAAARSFASATSELRGTDLAEQGQQPAGQAMQGRSTTHGHVVSRQDTCFPAKRPCCAILPS